ncbi:GAK system CofD-like protein [Rhodobacteraceae bacterium NNCM2]|nr:GAK system CofD-like protein [Coraliihabitans acroporae]
MSDVKISRNAELPDELRIARCKSTPNLGPRILFFSGGSALNDISRCLKNYTHNSVHLITPFDSGGSSRILRETFDMPAVGDLRSRLMALADETELGQPDIYRLFTHRFSTTGSQKELTEEFDSLLKGTHKLMRAISQPMRTLILAQFRVFAEHRPDDFDFRGASVGNLILAGGYISNDYSLEPVLFIMSKMVAVLGTVRAVVEKNLQLGAELKDGSTIIGQRQITGKESAPLTQPISRLFLANAGKELDLDKVQLPKRNRKLIERSDLICYPPGSLYSSVIANLLPRTVGSSIAERNVPKVYVPSLGTDPECFGMTLVDQVEALLQALRNDAGQDCPADRLINIVLCDRGSIDTRAAKTLAKSHGITCVGLDLRGPGKADVYHPESLCNALVSLT